MWYWIVVVVYIGVGNSVCCNVYGFEFYFYISCVDGIGLDDVLKFCSILEVRNFICVFGNMVFISVYKCEVWISCSILICIEVYLLID